MRIISRGQMTKKRLEKKKGKYLLHIYLKTTQGKKNAA